MNQAQLITHFERISDAPDAIPRLRRFIIDLAVRGKLIGQDQDDEPASGLLKRIQREKAKLIDQGYIRKQDQLPPIEEDQVPFSPPIGWSWTHLGEISKRLHYGFTASADPSITSVRLLRITDIQNNSVNWESVPGCNISKDELAHYKLERGDILIARTGGTIGKTFLIREIPVDAVFASYLIRAQVSSEIFQPYLKCFLESSVYWEQLQAGSRGTGQPNVNGRTLGQIRVAIPPKAEQHRVVTKVNELMILCDRLETAQAERERKRERLVAGSLLYLNSASDDVNLRASARFYFNNLPRLTTRTSHIQQLRQTILSLAVRGQLVPQDANDEPASVLLERLRKESATRLLTKQSKKNSTVTSTELDVAPFALPPGWAWAHFPELGTFGRGKSKHRPRNDPSLFVGGKHLLVQTGDVARSNGTIRTYTGLYNDVGLAQSKMWPEGTLCITIAANIADSGILGFDACFPDSVVGFLPASIFPNAKYFEYFVRTAKANLLEFAPATAQKNINLEILTAVMVPLPPLAEQERIVAKVDELMALCSRLEKQLTTAEYNAGRLLESILHAALHGVDMAPPNLELVPCG